MWTHKFAISNIACSTKFENPGFMQLYWLKKLIKEQLKALLYIYKRKIIISIIVVYGLSCSQVHS